MATAIKAQRVMAARSAAMTLWAFKIRDGWELDHVVEK
jgi:hypothetical protein